MGFKNSPIKSVSFFWAVLRKSADIVIFVHIVGKDGGFAEGDINGCKVFGARILALMSPDGTYLHRIFIETLQSGFG